MTPATGGSTDRVGRFFELYRETASSRSAIALVAANAIPLVGVAFFGWSLWTILVLYWVENGIVGFWTIPKILMARGSLVAGLMELAESGFGRLGGGEDRRSEATDLISAEMAAGGVPTASAGCLGVPLALFFLVHYGLFWLVHGIFVFNLPSLASLASNGTEFGEIAWSSVAIGALALFVSHGASFLFTYLGRGEYLRTSATAQMAAPYGRVVVLHLTIIFGAFVVAAVGAPIGALIILVVLKTFLDLGIHLRSHRPVANQAPA